MLENLKEQICLACTRLVAGGFIVGLDDRVSGIDRQGGKMLISPACESDLDVQPGDLIVVNIETGEILAGDPGDAKTARTHLELYRAFGDIGGIACISSLNATAWAQAMKPIPALGTIHAARFHGPIPCTRILKPEEIKADFEINIARAIVEKFAMNGIIPLEIPAGLVAGHQPLVWGETPQSAADNAIALEKVAKLARLTLSLEPYPRKLPDELIN